MGQHSLKWKDWPNRVNKFQSLSLKLFYSPARSSEIDSLEISEAGSPSREFMDLLRIVHTQTPPCHL